MFIVPGLGEEIRWSGKQRWVNKNHRGKLLQALHCFSNFVRHKASFALIVSDDDHSKCSTEHFDLSQLYTNSLFCQGSQGRPQIPYQ
jgi:hypothetical protein